MEQYMTPSDVSKAAAGEITPATVVAAADRGDLPVAARTIGGARLFREADVARYLRERKAQKG